MQSGCNDIYDDSHIEEGQSLGQAVISRFPLRNHQFAFFKNPQLKRTAKNGELWTSHNKGVTRCVADLGDKKLEILTMHSTPYRKFEIDPMGEETEELRLDIARKSLPSLPNCLLQGDLNFDQESLQEFLPSLFANGMQEYLQTEATTPKGRHYDHVMYKGLELKSVRVIDDVLADHYPLVCEFELTNKPL